MKRGFHFLLPTLILSGCVSSSRPVAFVGSYRSHVVIDEPERTLELKEGGRYQLTVFPSLAVSESGEPLPWIEFGRWKEDDASIVLKSDGGRSRSVLARQSSGVLSLEVDGVLLEREEEPNQPPQRNAGSRPSTDDPSSYAGPTDDRPASETPSSLGPRG